MPQLNDFLSKAIAKTFKRQETVSRAIPILKALDRKSSVLPGLLTKILVYSLRTAPRWSKIKIMEKVMGGMMKHQRT